MPAVRPNSSGPVNWPSPSSRATPPPYSRVGRSSGRVTRKNTPSCDEPATWAASRCSALMLSKPAATKRYTNAVSPIPVMMTIHGIV